MTTWSRQQEAAIKAVRAWLSDRRGPQIFRLFGFAGTGKTTIARELANQVKGLVFFACLSGKAALVMRKKGCSPSSTIHSLIYKPILDEDTGEVHYELNLESPLIGASLLVIDEVSMVDEDLARDLMQFGIRILVLGDPFQLPPVKGEGYFISAKPDVMLTEIHRQAADNPIIRMSMDIREGRGLKLGTYGDSRVIQRASIGRDEMAEIVLGADQVLCGLNKTRQSFNLRMRALRGIDSPIPVRDDRLICLKNNHEKGLLNGGLWEVKTVEEWHDHCEMRVASLDEPSAAEIDVSVLNEFWRGEEKEVDWRRLRDHDQFTYGYCLTTHKAQGSQFDNVALFDESAAFRDARKKWLYTGITRAAERVTVIV